MNFGRGAGIAIKDNAKINIFVAFWAIASTPRENCDSPNSSISCARTHSRLSSLAPLVHRPQRRYLDTDLLVFLLIIFSQLGPLSSWVTVLLQTTLLDASVHKIHRSKHSYKYVLKSAVSKNFNRKRKIKLFIYNSF